MYDIFVIIYVVIKIPFIKTALAKIFRFSFQWYLSLFEFNIEENSKSVSKYRNKIFHQKQNYEFKDRSTFILIGTYRDFTEKNCNTHITLKPISSFSASIKV